jgi:hypothetical protein
MGGRLDVSSISQIYSTGYKFPGSNVGRRNIHPCGNSNFYSKLSLYVMTKNRLALEGRRKQFCHRQSHELQIRQSESAPKRPEDRRKHNETSGHAFKIPDRVSIAIQHFGMDCVLLESCHSPQSNI